MVTERFLRNIDFYLPHIVSIIVYVILKVLQKQDQLKKFDKYLWSPLVVAFAMFDLLLMTVLHYDEIPKMMLPPLNMISFGFIGVWILMTTFILAFTAQILWIPLICQMLAICYKNKFLLKLSIILTCVGVLTIFCSILFNLFSSFS